MAEENKKHTLDEIIENLIDAVGEILEYKIAKALGLGTHADIEGEYVLSDQEQLLKLTTPLIQNYGVAKSIEAKNVQEVMTLLKKGKIKTSEANELLKLMKTKLAVEEQEEKNKLAKKISETV